MNWEETLIKSKNIKWKHLIKNTGDGKLDFVLHLPLTELFRAQAKYSFGCGMWTMMQFEIKHQEDKKSIEVSDVVALFNECGLPEIADKIVSTESGKMK